MTSYPLRGNPCQCAAGDLPIQRIFHGQKLLATFSRAKRPQSRDFFGMSNGPNGSRVNYSGKIIRRSPRTAQKTEILPSRFLMFRVKIDYHLRTERKMASLTESLTAAWIRFERIFSTRQEILYKEQ
jgi:hypothetical protein